MFLWVNGEHDYGGYSLNIQDIGKAFGDDEQPFIMLLRLLIVHKAFKRNIH